MKCRNSNTPVNSLVIPELVSENNLDVVIKSVSNILLDNEDDDKSELRTEVAMLYDCDVLDSTTGTEYAEDEAPMSAVGSEFDEKLEVITTVVGTA